MEAAIRSIAAFSRSSNSPRKPRPGHQRGQVEGDQPLAQQPGRDRALDDAQGQALHDRGLADPGPADQHRIVLRLPAQDLDQPGQLAVPADDRVELPRRAPSLRSRPYRQLSGPLSLLSVERVWAFIFRPRAIAFLPGSYISLRTMLT